MKIGLLQLNLVIGDLTGNADRIIDNVLEYQNDNIDLFVTSELALFGYPSKDLLFNQSLLEESEKQVLRIACATQKIAPLLLGTATRNSIHHGKHLKNSVLLLNKGNVRQQIDKSLLPNYDVFNENRYFESSNQPGQVLEIGGHRFGITICEDIWNDDNFGEKPLYLNNPLEPIRNQSIDCIINISASPFTAKKQHLRERMLSSIASRSKVPVIYVNQTGGNDDLIFDGRSCAFNSKGTLISKARAFSEDLLIFDLGQQTSQRIERDVTENEELWTALVMGTRDYVGKCGFKKAILGLSGGIDSALTATIAVEALGATNVMGVLLPSPYSSQGSIDDSLELAKRLQIQTMTIPIKPIMESMGKALETAFKGKEADTTEENIQARIRGNLLMALSNKEGSILLTTGNKSELAVGYCTIYGDMAGGLAVISDLPKTTVFQLSHWINQTKGGLIPKAILKKPPSAELSPNQKDQDSLPPYEILDQILDLHISQHLSAKEISNRGFDDTLVNKIIRLIGIAEFKRQQAAPGLKVTDRAFGSGWKMPIAAKKS